MRIAIIHYHLHPGGVTRVIESQLGALAAFMEPDDLAVFTGDSAARGRSGVSGIAFRSVPVFNYLEPDLSPRKMKTLYQEISTDLDNLAQRYDLIHVHNLNLGKNPLLTLAVSRLVKNGYPCINHCHDFAEDRPDRFVFMKSIIEGLFEEELTKVMYPVFPACHFAVLTSPDYERLTRMGVPAERISLLPNPVVLPAVRMEKERSLQAVRAVFGLDPKKALCIYPVRAIRRKNVGEFILLSVLFSDQAYWMITQPPKNPVELPEYNRWKAFCKSLAIPVIFEAGLAVDYNELLPAADWCITTSRMEGFGLAYMEPWLAGVPVTGRNLDNCTADLVQNGIEFPLLYDRFVVPFRKKETDFKELDQQQQQQVIREVLTGSVTGAEIRKLNPFLKDFLKPVSGSLVDRNRQVISKTYSSGVYGKTLYGLYQKLLGRA